jgi:hypothetical protein
MPDPITRTDNGSDILVNIRSPRFLIAQTVGQCWHCDAPTLLLALALPPGHETLELDHDAQDDEGSQDTWSVAPYSALLFYIDYIPDNVQRRLNGFTQAFCIGHSKAAAGFYWANHCEQCGSLLDDHELFCEPDGAFLPTTAASAGIIRLVAVDEAIEAAAAGYAYEPAFFDAMGKG